MIDIPSYLKDHKPEIIKVEERKISYNKDKWSEYLSENKEISDDLEKGPFKESPGQLKRMDIVKLIPRNSSELWPALRLAFLATMIWGWGNKGRGKHPTRTACNSHELKKELCAAWEYIKDGQLSDAYSNFKLPGCGPAFFTKFFYFIGSAFEIKPLPVILDSRVAKALEKLGNQEGWELSNFAKVNRNKNNQIQSIRRYKSGYMKYINKMDTWAKELGCSADQIECFLFENTKNEGGVYQVGNKEAENQLAIPSEELKDFATREIGEEAEFVIGFKKPPGWKGNFLVAQKGKLIELLFRDKKLKQFISESWPNYRKGVAEYGQRYKTGADKLHKLIKEQRKGFYSMSEVDWERFKNGVLFTTLENTPTNISKIPENNNIIQISLTSKQMGKLKEKADKERKTPEELVKELTVDYLL